MEEYGNKKRGREDMDEFEPTMPEAKKIREEDLLDLLNDSDPDPVVQDLDSVMKSFEKEISASPSPLTDVNPTSRSGDQPDLGFLLEASDDELGLPPSSINSTGDEIRSENIELIRVDSGDSSGIGELWGFEDGMPSYDWFELGVTESYSSDYAAFNDGLFDYSNVCYDTSEVSDYSWRYGFTPAE